MKNIINIINFVRSYDDRHGRDLVEPVREQLRIMRQYRLRGTFLLQYDAAVTEPYPTLMKENADLVEVGVWFEIVQPLVEAVGEKWRGRYPVWDFHCDVGSLMGYPPHVREKLIDEAMRKFKENFGGYPPCIGAWQIDAYSMRYASEKYGVKACCICRDEQETDFYTLGGGYYDKAYYPSKFNMLCPAQSKETQINMPVFRMLGSDPIYAYDFKDRSYGFDDVPTLEAAAIGRKQPWVDWYFSEIFSGRGLAFAYTQAGQENSFGWPRMKDGIEYQFPLIAKLRDEGKLTVQTLSDSGAWFSERYETTPPSTLTALSDWRNENRKSIWYSSAYYRANLFWENGRVFFRDIYVFDDRYKEKYLSEVCASEDCENRNLPVFDGVLYGQKNTIPGVYLEDRDRVLDWRSLSYEEKDGDAVITLEKGEHRAVLTFLPKTIMLETNIDGLRLVPRYDRECVYGRKYPLTGGKMDRYHITSISKAAVQKSRISFTFDGAAYALDAEEGAFEKDFSARPVNGRLRVCFLTSGDPGSDKTTEE